MDFLNIRMNKVFDIIKFLIDFVKENFTEFLLFLVILLLFFISMLFKKVNEYKDEYNREKTNVESLKAQIDTFRTKNGELVARTLDQEYTMDEMKKYYRKELELAKNSNVKTKTIEKIVNDTTIVYLEDTVYLQGTEQDYIGKYEDGWTTIDFQITGEELSFGLSFKDEQTIFLTYEKDKFNIWHPFKKRERKYYTTCVSSCPYAKHVAQTINVSKK